MAPIITSGLLLQFMAATRLLDVNMFSKEDRELFQSGQKLFTLVLAFVQAVGCTFSGMYGPVNELGAAAPIIIAQLFLGSFMIILLDELLQKGYGMGSGVSLFIGINICSFFLLSAFSFQTFPKGDTYEYEGAIIALLHNIGGKPNKLAGVQSAFFRSDGANIINCLLTIGLVLLVIYVQQYRVELRLSSKKMRGFRQPYPIKLIYGGNIALIVYTVLV
jgi:protein transport protein SEC61 subunit alpha